MHPQELQTAVELVNSGQAILIDVRRDDEWNLGHAEPAVHFTSEQILAGEMPNIEKTKPVYVYCVSGGRAGRVKTVMQNHGFLNVQNLGGLSDWYRAGGK